MSTETNILLPTASVNIFIKDKETAEAARSLVDDWRFARGFQFRDYQMLFFGGDKSMVIREFHWENETLSEYPYGTTNNMIDGIYAIYNSPEFLDFVK